MVSAITARAIQIDASAHCQLACPSCPTAGGDTRKALGAGHLKPAEFESLLDRNPEIQEVELSNYGELFLNPKLPEILSAAWERRVVLHADNGANLNFAPDATLEALVKYRFRSLTCSIDGASQETYRQYRVKGDFDRVIGNIRRLNEYKRQHRSGFPWLKWQFIVFGHNEHEIASARKLASELQMDFFAKLSWDDGVSPIRDRKLVQIQLRGQPLSREEYHRATGRDYQRSICYQLWQAPVLNWDGRVNGCCRNFWGHFGGNAFQERLREVLNREELAYARRMLTGQAPLREDLPCSTCDLYKTLERDKNWLTEAEIAPVKPGILVNVVVEAGEAVRDHGATHVDVFLAPGHVVNRVLLARPPRAMRFEIGRSFAVCGGVPAAGDFTIYALPKRLDPNFRIQYAPIAPVIKAITVEARPVAQEFRIEV